MMTGANTKFYLSRLILNSSSRQVMSEMAHPYEMHRTLMRAFPKASDDEKSKARDKFGVLFRADVDDQRGIVKVYVQSCIEPDWSFLSKRRDYLLPVDDLSNPAYKDVTETYQHLENGQVLYFRLRANPTKRISIKKKDEDPLKGKRVELMREEEQISWLIRKGQERKKSRTGGFEILMNEIRGRNGEIRMVPRVNVKREGKQRCRKKENGRSHNTTHNAVCFDGILRISDADAFRETLTRGVGSGKSFGFGLLSVASVNPLLHSEAV